MTTHAPSPAIISPAIHSAAEALEESSGRFAQTRFAIGFDGFVDEILHAVDTRQSSTAFERILTIPQFSRPHSLGRREVGQYRGRSDPGQTRRQRAPDVFGRRGHGRQGDLHRALGLPPHSTRIQAAGRQSRTAFDREPGSHRRAEFQDGKLMIGKLDTIQNMCWQRLQDIIGADRFQALMVESDLVACTNWTMLTEMDEILENLIRMIPEKSTVRFFFDLADPEKRDRADLERVLGQIRALNKRARCILGLNLREAEQVSEVLGLAEAVVETPASVEAASTRIAQAMGLHGVVVHAVRCAGAFVDGETAGIEGPYCGNPRLSTGAGDHFNGGFVSGLMSGLDTRGALYSGVGTSGWYVRNARSPERSDVIGFLKDWAAGKQLD